MAAFDVALAAAGWSDAYDRTSGCVYYVSPAMRQRAASSCDSVPRWQQPFQHCHDADTHSSLTRRAGGGLDTVAHRRPYLMDEPARSPRLRSPVRPSQGCDAGQ